MRRCLNLCEILNKQVLENDFIHILLGTSYEQVYFGSYFCSQYFLEMTFCKAFISYIKTKAIGLTLVIPIFSENDLYDAKMMIDKILTYEDHYIREVTVNDIGMLYYIRNHYKNIKVNMGRLFFKYPRDFRVLEFTKNITASIDVNIAAGSELCNGIFEIDETNDALELVTSKVKTGIHYPLCYMTTGNICKFASIHVPLEKKFRPNSKCHKECQRIIECYRENSNYGTCNVYRIGRTVYFERNIRSLSDISNMMIYFPIYELLNFYGGCCENLSSTK